MNCKNKCAYAIEFHGMTVCVRDLRTHIVGKYEFWQPDGAMTCMILPDGRLGIYPVDIKYCDMATKEDNEKTQAWFD
ncbi:MAG: hypothetical protein M0R51_11980 [Clostridia bacterium]|jgi:hypothetical protein|nr:hypothetical protein [Clostridia bacterium]